MAILFYFLLGIIFAITVYLKIVEDAGKKDAIVKIVYSVLKERVGLYLKNKQVETHFAPNESIEIMFVPSKQFKKVQKNLQYIELHPKDKNLIYALCVNPQIAEIVMKPDFNVEDVLNVFRKNELILDEFEKKDKVFSIIRELFDNPYARIFAEGLAKGFSTYETNLMNMLELYVEKPKKEGKKNGKKKESGSAKRSVQSRQKSKKQSSV